MKKPLIFCLVIALAGCGGSGNNSNSQPAPNNPPATVTLQSKLQGNWERRGYGRLLNINGSTIRSYDFTTETCVLAETDTDVNFDGIELTTDETAFTIKDVELAVAEHYAKVDSLPTVCESPISDAPTAVYDHVWHTFNEYYAFFNERNVDWLAQLDATRNAVHNGISDETLFDVLSNLLMPIDDQHVSLEAPDRFYEPAQPKGFIATLLQEFEAQSEITDVSTYFANEIEQWESNLLETYLDDNVQSAGGIEDNLFIWGTIGGEIAYLRLDAMLLTLEESIAAQLVDIELILDQALSDLANTQAMIVDIRFNGGGADPISLAVARRFTDTERLVFSKFTRTLEGEGAIQSATISPVNRPSYLNPVVLITSGFSTSAAEVFTLAMRTLPQMTHIGEHTNGALSDVLEKPLPNGWKVNLANEVYLDADGVSYEAVGIPPHIEAPVFRRTERETGQDSAVNAALELLGIEVGEMQ